MPVKLIGYEGRSKIRESPETNREKCGELRRRRGWTLEEAEQKGWKNWRHLQKIEGGKNITVITLQKLANLYEVDPADLLK